MNRQLTYPEKSDDSNLSSEEAASDQDINFQSDFLSNSWDISSELSSDNEESETEERITESENLLHKM